MLAAQPEYVGHVCWQMLQQRDGYATGHSTGSGQPAERLNMCQSVCKDAAPHGAARQSAHPAVRLLLAALGQQQQAAELAAAR
jgi:hypothetical protein